MVVNVIEKAFDNLEIQRLFQILEDRGIVRRHIEVLKRTYENCTAVLKMNRHFSDPFPVSCGVGQGDPVSPLLFIVDTAYIDTSHYQDPTLWDVCTIPALELVDDTSDFNKTREGLQWKMASRKTQLASRNLTTSIPKSKYTRIGYVEEGPPPGDCGRVPHHS